MCIFIVLLLHTDSNNFLYITTCANLNELVEPSELVEPNLKELGEPSELVEPTLNELGEPSELVEPNETTVYLIIAPAPFGTRMLACLRQHVAFGSLVTEMELET